MDCGHLEELSEWFDGELDPERKARFEAHMAGCAACRRARGELLALRDRLRPVTPDADPDQRRRALERILASGRPPVWRRQVGVPVPALAALALLVAALGGLALRGTAPPGPAGPEAGPAAASRTATPGASTHAKRPPGRTPAPAGPAPESGAAIDLARFDHGERAVLYKIPRPPAGEAAR